MIPNTDPSQATPPRYHIWIAEPPREAPAALMPWECVGIERAERAHTWARLIRQRHPRWLVAVRPESAGEPPWPERMADYHGTGCHP